MPSIVTHYLFAKDVQNTLPKKITFTLNIKVILHNIALLAFIIY